LKIIVTLQHLTVFFIFLSSRYGKGFFYQEAGTKGSLHYFAFLLKKEDVSKTYKFESNDLETACFRFCQSYVSTISKMRKLFESSAYQNDSSLTPTFIKNLLKDTQLKVQINGTKKLTEDCNKYYYYCLGSLLILVEEINRLIKEKNIKIVYNSNNETITMDIFTEDLVLMNLSSAFSNLVVLHNNINHSLESTDTIIDLNESAFVSNIDYNLARIYCQHKHDEIEYKNTSYFISNSQRKNLLKQKMKWHMVEECCSVQFSDIANEEMYDDSIDHYQSLPSLNQDMMTNDEGKK
jgi:hypothetical protein